MAARGQFLASVLGPNIVNPCYRDNLAETPQTLPQHRALLIELDKGRYREWT
jgi:hypothetical protein